MQSLLAVMAGGAIGAGLRFLVSTQVGRWMGAAFPWGTLTVNVVGSAAMGLLVGLFAHLWSLGDPWRAFLTVGLLGGFTTFSAFSLEVVLEILIVKLLVTALCIGAGFVGGVFAF